MNESYAECLVRRRIPFYSNIVNIVMGVVTAFFFFFGRKKHKNGIIRLFSY